MNVICCTISLYDHLHRRNRKSFSGYFEVFLDTPFQQLRERDRKKLYSTEMPHVAKNVVGVDLPYNKPKNPDLVIKNIKSKEELLNYAAPLVEKILVSK